MLLHEKFTCTRPLTVTGAFQQSDGRVFFHQMILDRIENRQYILQNTLISHSGTQLRIPLQRQYYASYDFIVNYSSVYSGPKGEFLTLVNESIPQTKMVPERWYLLPQAYSIILTPTVKN